MIAAEDLQQIADQLGREPRGALEVAARCPSGHPAVVRTEPRLPDGTPFPTLFYITCPRLSGAIGTLEASGLMTAMSERLEGDDDALKAQYQAAHESYLRERTAIEAVAEIEGISAGGMPTRVKCLHVLVGHALAKGPGVNPFGDEAVALLGAYWGESACAPPMPQQ
jgi:hypothetical protein